MAAPSGTKWSTAFGSGNNQAKFGFYVKLSNDDTTTTVTAEIWYATIYDCIDSSNTFYRDWDSSPGTSLGAKSINHTVPAVKWSTKNQTKIWSGETTFTRTSSNQTKYISAKCTGIEYGGYSGSGSLSFTIPAITSTYTVSYNANGGSGAPAAQTKTHGKSLTLSSTKPTRSTYKFAGWGTDPDDIYPQYLAGSTYDFNSAVTLYAVWHTVMNTGVAAGGSYKPATPYIYTGGAWKEVREAVYTGGVWREDTLTDIQ